MSQLISEFEYTKADEANERKNPTRIPIKRALYNNLNAYRSSLKSYDHFRKSKKLVEGLAHLKDIFTRKYPDFEGTGFQANEGGYWKDERSYKQELIAQMETLLRADVGSDEQLGSDFIKLIEGSNEIIGWRTNYDIKNTDSDTRKAILTALGKLLRSQDDVADIAGDTAAEIRQALMNAGNNQKLNIGGRALVTTALALAQPNKAIAVKNLGAMNEMAEQLTEHKPFEQGVLIGSQYREFLTLARAIFEIMKDEWKWAPRDLWDVQGFLWVASYAGKEVPDTDEEEEDDDMNDNTLKLTVPTNLILHGPPGTGKTHVTAKKAVSWCDGKQFPDDRNQVMQRYRELIEQKRISFVTFHQSYAYEDFVEGLRPDTGEGSGGGFTLKPHPGIFRRIADLARANESEPYVLIIDEINRANVSKVFGELITLIEPDKRLRCENELTVSLPYSGDTFGIPANLHLIGTMNTADRSIALLDTALRRRFEFEEMMPDPALLDEASNATGIDVESVLTQLNERIEYLFDRDHQIGHAFFMNCKTQDDLDVVMRHKVIPLLVEYFYEDWEKVRQVLNESTDEGSFVTRTELPSPTTGEDEAPDIDRWRYEVRSRFASKAYDQLMQ